MVTATDFLFKVAELQDDLRGVTDISDAKTVTETAERLEGLNYAPTVILPVADFLRIKKIDLLAKIEEIISLSDEEVYELSPGDPRSYFDMKLQYIATLVYYFKQLVQLRRGNAEAWDEVDELYVHD
ncbi:hypothetical protein [Desulfosediminicola flagellatus]|uniref:hypothetical protein n=1 Tax=Desulfosediminicola flagellatus TaxID=2569541 RepID=UPI0010ABA6A0|nr:hypothetical protein [Desulfosediminicola flagellatus]